MTATSDARHTLWTALTEGAAVPWRIHEWTPDQVVAPAVFIGDPTLDRTTVGTPGVSVVVATFPVYAVADGAPEAQSRKRDEMTAFIWDAAFACGASPDNSRPTAIDVGGPSLRGAVVQVDMTIRALTLCAPTLEVLAHG